MDERSSAPAAPTLVAPVENEEVDEQAAVLRWDRVPNATGYHLQVAQDPRFEELLCDEEVGTSTSFRLDGLPEQAGVTLYWRVRAQTENATGAYSEAARFRTADTTAAPTPSADEGGGATRQREWTFMMAAMVLSIVIVAVTAYLLTDVNFGAVEEEETAEADTARAAADTLTLDEYGVVQEEGAVTYRIPIERAIELMAGEGQPALTPSSGASGTAPFSDVVTDSAVVAPTNGNVRRNR